MELNEQNIVTIRGLLINTLSSDNTTLRNAENYLKKVETEPGFVILLLHVISTLLASNDSTEKAIRLSAAVFFKNCIKRCWEVSKDLDGNTNMNIIALSDRDTIKTHLVDLMCTAPADIQRQLAEAVTIIAKYDFPKLWTNLLGQLVHKLTISDITITKGVMLTANSIMKKFRYTQKSDAIFEELIVCLNEFHNPLLEVYKMNSVSIQNLATNKEQLTILVDTRRLMTRIFFSFNWLDLPEVFEDNMAVWMSEFLQYLDYKNPLLVDVNEENEAGPIERLQSAIIDNISLYASKYDEEFAPYLPQFTQAIWSLLMTVGSQAKYDILATSAIKFLTSIVSKERNAGLFSPEILKNIIEKIVVPSVMASENDQELFEDNPIDYIRKDLENIDVDTRRRCATELVRSLLKSFSQVVSDLCAGYANAMLEQYRIKRDWKIKDAAMHLVLAASVLSTSAASASQLNDKINIMDFFNSHVLPEVNDVNVNSDPIVKATALKLVCIFRSHLQASFLIDLLGHIIRHLSSKFVVNQTYAAYCIEKFLSIKDNTNSVNGTSISTVRISKEHLLPHIQLIFTVLFNALENPDATENEYIMKCIMRCLVLLGRDVTPVIPAVLNKLTLALERVYKNPTNPYYSHYLFECIAVLVTSSCHNHLDINGSLSYCSNFEAILFPPFQVILAQEVTEFIPYVFQVLALLLSARQRNSGLSSSFQMLLPPLLTPALWESKGNIPGLVDLLRSYIIVGMNDILKNNHVQSILGVFQKLLASKTSEVYAFKLINEIFSNNSCETLQQYIPTIFSLLVQRMREQFTPTSPNPKYCKYFFHTICLFSSLYGGRVLYDVFESSMPGTLKSIILVVWSANIQACCSLESFEIKQLIVGATKFILESPISQNPESWIAVFMFILQFISSESGGSSNNQVEYSFKEEEEDAESRQFDSAYSKLAYAQLPEPVLSSEVIDATGYFARSVGSFTANHPNQYRQIIQAKLATEKGYSEILQQTLLKFGINLQ